MTFGQMGQLELSQDGRLLVASVRDLMATKLKALLNKPACSLIVPNQKATGIDDRY